MNAAADRLAFRVLAAQLVAGALLAAILAVAGPRLLLIDHAVASAALAFGAACGAPLALLTLLLVRRRLARQRFVLRALALGSSAIESDDVIALTRIPGYVATLSIGLATVVPLALVSPLRPAVVDFDTALSFALLAFVIASTAALPLFVVVRASIGRALELVHPDVMHERLERERRGRLLRRRIVVRLLAAIATPVGLVAVGAALLAHAHVRNLDEASRERTAEAIAYALEEAPGSVPGSGRAEAMQTANELGFTPRVTDETLRFAIERGDDGRVSFTTPLESGSAVVRFAATGVSALTAADIGVALAAVLVAAVLGYGVGRSLTSDLSRATERLALLSTDAVLRGEAPAPPRARWGLVARLYRAIDTLTERFRVFAAAQERAIEAREAARRTRSLLFASVSHDLRNPLNAILGFTAIVAETPLTHAQRESLGFIEQRGRELLALIETILEVARVEAGRLALVRAPAEVRDVTSDAIRRGRELAGGRPVDVVAEIQPELPPVQVDAPRLSQALAALIGHATRVFDLANVAPGTRWTVRVRATRRTPEQLELEVEYPEGTIPADQVARLLVAEPEAASQRRYGGLTLGLSLARALVELHGGTLRVLRGAGGTTRLRVRLPSPYRPPPARSLGRRGA